MMSSPPSGEAARPTAPRATALWRDHDFALLWSGQFVSSLGTAVSTLALPLLVLALTHSPAQAGFVAAARGLPYVIFSLPAGVLVDRWNRKAMMIRCDIIRWLALGSVPLAFALGRLTLLQVYVIALVEGTAYVFFSLAQIASLPRVVAPAQLSRAYALNEASDAAGTLLGPGLGGTIISLARTVVGGTMLTYLLDSLSYLVSVFSLRLMRTPFQMERVPAARTSLWAEMRVGLRFLWGERRLRLMALLLMALNFLLFPVDLAIIVLARQTLHVDVRTLGLIFSASGAVGLLSALVAPWVRARVRFGVVVVVGVGVWVAAVSVLAAAGSPVALLAGRALISAVWPIYGVVLVTYRLSLTPDALQGRVNSAFRVLSFSGDPLGGAVGGLALAAFGPRAMLWLAALGLVGCALFAGLSELRQAG
ncbi:MAG: MFS transporter [Ktedonobacterales bacterium]|nr:MFS transporter [Ktedonobacterales bacterium]